MAANFQHMVLIGGVVKQCVVSLIDHSSLDTENSKSSDTFRVACCRPGLLDSTRTSRIEHSCLRYLLLFWPVQQMGADVKYNLNLSLDRLIS